MLHSSLSGTTETQDPTGSHQVTPVSSPLNDSFMDGHQTYSSLISSSHIFHTSIPLILDDFHIHGPLSSADATHHSQSPRLVRDAVPSEAVPMSCSDTSPTVDQLAYDPQCPVQLSVSFECHRNSYLLKASSTHSENDPTPPSESPTSQCINPLDLHESLVGNPETSPEYSHDLSVSPSHSETNFESQSSTFHQLNTVVPPRIPAPPLLPSSQQPPASHVTAPRQSWVPIAPAPSSHEQCAWTSPYSLFPNLAAPFHRLAIISQSTTHKRRRRRCTVCLQSGQEEASFECPGRGDRTRCPSHQGVGEERNVLKSKQKCDQKAKDRNKAFLPPIPESTSTPSSALHQRDVGTYFSQSITRPVAPKGVLTTHILYPTQSYAFLHEYPLPASQPFVIAPGERRSRRCMVCVAQDKDGMHCPGRGNRALCPNREATEDSNDMPQVATAT